MLFVKGSQCFDCLFVSPFRPMNPRANMKAIDVEPTELMNRFGKVDLHRLQVSGNPTVLSGPPGLFLVSEIKIGFLCYGFTIGHLGFAGCDMGMVLPSHALQINIKV